MIRTNIRLMAAALCGIIVGCASATPNPAPAKPVETKTDDRAAARTQHEQQVQARMKAADYAKGYDARLAALKDTSPTAEQCGRLTQSAAHAACDPAKPGCAQPADNLSNMPPPPAIPNGCTVPPEAKAEGPAGSVGVKEPYATQLEGCDAAFVTWLYRTCP